jgi:hypothetical protein
MDHPLSPTLGVGRGQNRGLDLMQQATFHLLHGSGIEDAFQSLLYLAHPIGEGCRQCV